MPQRFDADTACYHTVSVTRNRAPIFADPAIASLLVDCIGFISKSGRAEVLAYAVMPDHLHLLLAPRGDNTLSQVMHTLKRYAVKRINDATGRSGSLWQQSFYDRAIRDDAHLRATIDYIHQNAVAEGLVLVDEDYRFSSAHPDALSDLEAFLSE